MSRGHGTLRSLSEGAYVYRARFVVPRCDLAFFVKANIDGMDAQYQARVSVTELDGPRIVNRALFVAAIAVLRFVSALNHLLRCCFADVDGSVDVRMLFGQDEFEFMTGEGRRVIDELESTTKVKITAGCEVYPLSGDMAIRVVGSKSAVVRFICRVNEILRKAKAATVRFVDQRSFFTATATSERPIDAPVWATFPIR